MPQTKLPRVLLVSLHTSPVEQPGSGDAGGMNVYVAHLARGLSARGWAVDMATLQRDPAAAQDVTVRQLPDGPRLLSVSVPGAATATKDKLPDSAAAFGRTLTRFYRHDTPLVVHAHYWLSAVAARELSDVLRIPLVVTLHTSAAVKNSRAGPGESGEPLTRERAERDIVGGSHALVVNTALEAEHMTRFYQARRDAVWVIPPGVDPEIFHPADTPGVAEARREGEGFSVLCAGRMQALKGPDILVSALGILRRDHPHCPVSLVLAGMGEPVFLQHLHQLVADHDIADAVTFRGPLPARDLADLMRSVDAVAMPSSSETFGLVALEAQACAAPVLATDVDGLRYAVVNNSTGWLIPDRSPRTWARAILRAASHPTQWRAMSAAAARHAGRLTWGRVAAHHEDVYLQCAGQRPHALDSIL